LSPCLDEVSLVEREEIPAQPANRRGVSQGRHIHGLLGGGRQALEALFPGITDEWLARGALLGDVTDDVLWCNEGAFHFRFHSNLTGVLLSRPLLEYQVRARTLALPNVRIQRAEATGLSIDHSGRRVTGVEVRRANGDSESLEAELVVDASGRGSRAPTWLAAAGLPVPGVENVQVNLAYVTRYYRRRPTDLGDLNGVVVVGTPAHPRSGAILAQEDDRWVLTFIGYAGDAAPTAVDGFLASARTLPIPHIATFLATAEPVTEFFVTRFASNQRHRFERLANPPKGFLAFGDSISSLNPLYGQGMTLAAMEGVALQECLTSGVHDLERRFYAAAGKLIDIPWSIAVGNDLRMPGVVGKR